MDSKVYMICEEWMHNPLEHLLLDERAEPRDLPLSILKDITNNFSCDLQIGSGGFAAVYKGLLRNGTVAVKKLSQTLEVDDKKFNREVTCLMKVNHKNIVRFMGYCSDTQGKMSSYEGKIVMADVRQRLLCFEYLPNGSLEGYITDSSQGLPWKKRYKIIKGICEGLHYLHKKEILHLDLKPANILLDDNMVPKIADFGLSRCFDEKQSRSSTSKLIGSMGYLAPEFYSRVITFKLDIYSFGVIIMELLTGQKGYHAVEKVVEDWRHRMEISEGDMRLEHVRVCAEIGIVCIDPDPAKRPVTQHIIETLDEMEITYAFMEAGMNSFRHCGEGSLNSSTTCTMDPLENKLNPSDSTKDYSSRRESTYSDRTDVSDVHKKNIALDIGTSAPCAPSTSSLGLGGEYPKGLFGMASLSVSPMVFAKELSESSNKRTSPEKPQRSLISFHTRREKPKQLTSTGFSLLPSLSPIHRKQEKPYGQKIFQKVFGSSRTAVSIEKPQPKPCQTGQSIGNVYFWGKSICDTNSRLTHHRSTYSSDAKTDILLPKPLVSNMMLDVSYVACGVKHAALITSKREIFTWGEEISGCLGSMVGTNVGPRLVETLARFDVDEIACGEFHTCAVTTNGELYTWGDDTRSSGLLGHGNNMSHWIPRRVLGPLEGLTVETVSCGIWHTALITSFGKLYTFGDGSFGVLGHGDRESTSYPKEVESLKGLRTISVSCGVWHTAAVVEVIVSNPKSYDSHGKLFTWGDGDKQRLGHGDWCSKLRPTCVAPLIDYDFYKTACGNSITIGLTTSGHIFTMGNNVYGQLGNPKNDGRYPTLVEGTLKDGGVVDVACGSYHVAVLTNAGKVYTWGLGRNGRLGHGDIADRNVPRLVEALNDRFVKYIACGSCSTAAISESEA